MFINQKALNFLRLKWDINNIRKIEEKRRRFDVLIYFVTKQCIWFEKEGTFHFKRF